MSASRPSNTLPWRWIALGAVLVAITIGWFFLPVASWVKAMNAWLEQRGIWGGIIFAAIYVVATIALAPGAPLTLAAGLAFGIAWGLPLVVVSATIGATLAFLVARYLAREKIAAWAEQRPKFKAINQAVSEEGWKAVVLLRLSPLIPFNLQNYFYGITDISLKQYVLATLGGIVPGTLMYVYLGAVGNAVLGAGQKSGGSTLKGIFFAVGLVATIVVTVLVTKKAKAKLKAIGVEKKTS